MLNLRRIFAINVFVVCLLLSSITSFATVVAIGVEGIDQTKANNACQGNSIYIPKDYNQNNGRWAGWITVSQDGKSWDRVYEREGWGVGGIAWNGKRWAAVGQDSQYNGSILTCNSHDGKGPWISHPIGCNYGHMGIYGIAGNKNDQWLASGFFWDGKQTYFPFLMKSSNGSDWEIYQARGVGSSLCWCLCTKWDPVNKQWIIAGNSDGYSNIHTSQDGAYWYPHGFKSDEFSISNMATTD